MKNCRLSTTLFTSLALVLAACAPAPAQVATSTLAPTPTLISTSPPTPISPPQSAGLLNPAAEGKTLIFITQRNIENNGDGDVTQVGDIRQQRNQVWTWEQKASDPRLVGTVETRFSVDMRPDRSADMWGTVTLTNEGGSWEGNWTGTIAKSQTTHYILATLEGKGAYAGLTYHLQAHFVESGEGFSPEIEVVGTGWIAEE